MVDCCRQSDQRSTAAFMEDHVLFDVLASGFVKHYSLDRY